MARVELPVTVLNSTTGLPVAGASIAASFRASGTPATWYTTETGGSGSTAAIITDSVGRATAWFPRGAYNLAVTGTGITPYTEPWDAYPASDASLEIAQIADNTITLAKLVTAVQQSLVPTGTVSAFAGTSPPSGYFICDGQAINRTTYAALFAVIGTAYGAGDGSTTFNVPNLAGRVPVGFNGADTAFDSMGEVGGAKTVTLSSTESGIAAHAHTGSVTINAADANTNGSYPWIPMSNGAWDSQGVAAGISFSTARALANLVSYTALNHAHTGSVTINTNSGAAAASAHQNLQPYQVVNFIIKAV